MIKVIKSSWQRYKLGEDFSKYSNKLLIIAQVWNFLFITFGIIGFRVKNYIFTILCILIILHYLYRAYLVKKESRLRQW